MTNMRRVLSGLLPSRRYAVRIRGLNRVGVSSNWSEALEFTTPADDSIPKAPVDLVVDFETPDLILQWSAVNENIDHSPLMDFAHYKVTLLVPGGASKTYETRQNFFILPFRQNTTDFGAAQPQFSVAIRTVDVDGKESSALTGNATNAAPKKPQDPDGFATFTMLSVSMAPHPDDNDIEYYVIERAEDLNGPFDVVATTSGDTFIDTGVESLTYYFRYKVLDFFAQESPYSEVLQLTTTGAPGIDTDPPEAVQDFASPGSGIDDATGRAYIDFTWSPNVVDDDLSHFEMRAVRTSDNFVRSVIIGPGASSHRLANLEEDTQYSIIIYAYDYMGNRSDPSTELTITTPVDDTAPVAPTGTGVSSSFRSLTVYWDSEFNPRFSHYEVYGSKTQGFTPDTVSHSNKLFSGNASRFVHHVADEETWYFRVRTLNNNDAASGFTDEFSGSSPDGIQSNEPGAPSEAQFRVDAAGNMWIGDEDFVSAPFSVSNLGSALMRNVIITGDDMTTGQRIIDTPAFIVTKDGEVTASEINATGGTIGGVTINETNLSGGEINGSTFNIGSGGVNFTGSGNITWEDTANGGIELAHSGFINNSAYRNDNTTGWHIDDNGIVINEGIVSANAIQIGVSSENLFVNSAFTEGTVLATNWASTFGSGGAASFEVSDTLWAYLGKSQHVEVTTSGTWAGVRQDVSRAGGESFANDETIAVSFWVRQSEGAARTAKVFVQTPAGATLWDGNNISLTVGAWTRVIAVFRLATAQPELRVSLRINNPQVGDEFYIDGAQLQISDFITDYAPRTLEIPTNYIQSANIASLSADRLTSGQIATAELILTGAGTIRNDPQSFQIDGDGAIFENGGITLIGGGEGGVGYVKMDSSSFRLIAGSDTDSSANTKFKVDRTGVYIGGNDTNTADVYFTDKTVFQSSGSGYNFTINTDPSDDKILKLTTGGGSPIENFYLTTDGEAYFMGGVVGGTTSVDPGTIAAGGITNLINFDGGGLEHLGVGGVFRLDGSGLRFWSNPAGTGTPSINLNATTGAATFAGTLSGATGSFSGSVTATGGAITGNLTVSGRLEAGANIWIGNNVGESGTWHGINLEKGSQSAIALNTGWVRTTAGRILFRINHNGDSSFSYDSNSGVFVLKAFSPSTWNELEINGNTMISTHGILGFQSRVTGGEVSVRAVSRPWQTLQGSHSTISGIGTNQDLLKLFVGHGAHVDGGYLFVDGAVYGHSIRGRSGGGSQANPTIIPDMDFPNTGMYSLASNGEIRFSARGNLSGFRIRATGSTAGDPEFNGDIHYPQSVARQFFDGSGRIGWHAASYASGNSPIFDIRAEIGGTNYKSFRSMGMSDTASTGAAANVHITSAGNFNVSTSSVEFKKDIEDIEPRYYRKVLDMHPIWFRPNEKSVDRKDWSHYGLLAEEVAEIEPRLVHWCHKDGAAAMAEYEDQGLTPPDDELVPKGVQYDRIVVWLIGLVQEQQNELKDLQSKVATLSQGV